MKLQWGYKNATHLQPLNAVISRILRGGCICPFLTATPKNVDMTSFHTLLLHFMKNCGRKHVYLFFRPVFWKQVRKTGFSICRMTTKSTATLQPLRPPKRIKPAIPAFPMKLQWLFLLQPRCKVNATAIFSTCYKCCYTRLFRGCSWNATPALKKIGKCEIASSFCNIMIS